MEDIAEMLKLYIFNLSLSFSFGTLLFRRTHVFLSLRVSPARFCRLRITTSREALLKRLYIQSDSNYRCGFISQR